MRSGFVIYLLITGILGVYAGFNEVELNAREYDYDTPDITPERLPEHNFPLDPNDFEEMAIQIKRITTYIKSQEEHFQFFSHPNETFVLGLPRSGKSTFIYFLTHDNSKLIATRSNSGNLIIKSKINKFDQNNEIYPLVSVDENNKYFVEIPSLKYNSYYPNDFAAGYFTKKIIEATRHPKFILTISYSPNMFSENNTDIQNLLIHSGSLLRSILRFTKSFAIVVTKVPRVITMNNVILTDEQFKDQLANYLISLKPKIDRSAFYRNTIWKTRKIIDYLTEKDNKNIGLFKVPIKEGPISEDPELQSEKEGLVHLINDHLKFAIINPDCIKYVAFTDYSTIHTKDFGRDRHLYFSRYFSTFMQAGNFIKSMVSFFNIGTTNN